jgi:hypothetical protein
MTTLYESQLQPMDDGWGLVVTISATEHNHYWTSPLTRVKGATYEEARESARAQVVALKRALDGPQPEPVCGALAVFWPDDECCEAVCFLDLGHDGQHEDEFLGEWSEEELPTTHPKRLP